MAISSDTRNRPLGKRCDADYLTARIARDRPDILARMKAGEFASVRRAALEAGIVAPTFACPLDPAKAARRIAKRFSGVDLDTLIQALQDVQAGRSHGASAQTLEP